MSEYPSNLSRKDIDWHVMDLRNVIASLCSVMTAEQRDLGLEKHRATRPTGGPRQHPLDTWEA